MDVDKGHQPPPATPTSVVAVVLTQFLLSAAVLTFWGLELWGLVVFYRRYPTNHQVLGPSVWIFYIGLPVAFALLGIVTSLGLVRLREWARRSTIFLSVVPVATYALLLIIRPASLFPSARGHGGIYAIGDVYSYVVGFLVVILAVISIWWLVVFTQPGVKAKFQAAACPGEVNPKAGSLLD
jgi:hypothetical protein